MRSVGNLRNRHHIYLESPRAGEIEMTDPEGRVDSENDAVDAHDALAMVDRILSRADVSECSLSGSPFIIWGIVGGTFDALVQLVVREGHSPNLFLIGVALYVFALVWMILWARRLRTRDRSSLLNRYVSVAFTLAWTVALAMQFAPKIFSDWSQAAVWSMTFGSALISVGWLARERLVMTGGAVLILSIIAANFLLSSAGYVLSAGMLLGMTGTGIALLAVRR